MFIRQIQSLGLADISVILIGTGYVFVTQSMKMIGEGYTFVTYFCEAN